MGANANGTYEPFQVSVPDDVVALLGRRRPRRVGGEVLFMGADQSFVCRS